MPKAFTDPWKLMVNSFIVLHLSVPNRVTPLNILWTACLSWPARVSAVEISSMHAHFYGILSSSQDLIEEPCSVSFCWFCAAAIPQRGKMQLQLSGCAESEETGRGRARVGLSSNMQRIVESTLKVSYFCMLADIWGVSTSTSYWIFIQLQHKLKNSCQESKPEPEELSCKVKGSLRWLSLCCFLIAYISVEGRWPVGIPLLQIGTYRLGRQRTSMNIEHWS